MKKKIVGIFIFILIFASSFPAIGNINKKEFFSDKSTIEFAYGEFIVKLKEESTFLNPSLVVLNEKHQVYTFESVFPNAENTILDNIYLLHVPMESDILSIVKEYMSCPDVMYAEPNSYGALSLVPNDEYYSIQWNLNNSGQFGGTPDADIDASEAWDIETGSPDVVISIIDSGIDNMHPDLVARIWNNIDEIPGNSIDDDANGYIDDVMGWDFYYNDNNITDGHGHGTACAGIPCAVTNNDIGIAGVCWNCMIMPVRIANESWWTTTVFISKGIQYAADNGADIISISFTCSNSYTIRDAVNYAYTKGVFLCAAAGNQNSSTPIYPGSYENVTAVAATNQDDERCTEDDWLPGMGSNYGDWVDIAAPGALISTTLPTFYGYNYSLCNGTSMSAPMVAGVAALLLSRDYSLTPDEIKTLICENVDPYNSIEYIGTGRINAQKALDALNQLPGPPIIDGPSHGKVDTALKYNFTSVDPNNDDIAEYIVNWGYGTENKTITGPFASGQTAKGIYTWHKKGDYVITAKAIDIYGAESELATLEVTIPRDRSIRILFSRLLDHFPHLFLLFR